ncbi:MAG: FAD binding domain-containing protein [Pseudomonadota bacterium]
MIEVQRCTTLSEAAGYMGPRARFLAGGTLVMRAVNYGDQGVDRIVRAADPALGRIAAAGERIEIGAGVTMADVLAARELSFLHPVARRVGGPAVRAMATVGGNLFAAHPYGDMATALLALDGRISTADGRQMALDQLLAERDGFGGLVASISIARPRDREFRFHKVSRVKPKGVSVMCMAAWLPGGGRITGARVAYGAMGPAPQRVPAVERALEGASLTEAGIAPALAAATEGVSPPDDALASAWYRREVAPVHLKRMLLDGGAP